MAPRSDLLVFPRFAPALALLVSLGAVATGCSGGETISAELPSEAVGEPDGTVIEPTAAAPVCFDFGMASFLDSLRPALEIDSFSWYRASTEYLCMLPDYQQSSELGSICKNAAEPASCEDEVERLVAGSADWGMFHDDYAASWNLLVVTGAEASIAALGGPIEQLSGASCGSWERGERPWTTADPVEQDGGGGAGGAGPAPAEPFSRNATTIADRATLLKFLGTIDTPTEAALVMWAHSFEPPCDIQSTSDGYRAVATKRVFDCPDAGKTYELTVSAAGELEARVLDSGSECPLAGG